jgi:CRP-like cAMP-binding protein
VELKDIGHVRKLRKGDILFNEGDEGDEMFLIKSGKIRIVKEMDNGEEKILAFLGEGSFFGEMAILDNIPRSASAIAEVDTELIIVDREAFLSKINENPFIKYTISTLTHRLRRVNEMWIYRGIPNDKIRFIRYLKYRTKKSNLETDIDTGIPDNIEEISVILAIDKNKLKEYLKELEKEDIIEMDKAIIIKSIKKLNEFEKLVLIQEECERLKEYKDISSLSEEFKF